MRNQHPMFYVRFGRCPQRRGHLLPTYSSGTSWFGFLCSFCFNVNIFFANNYFRRSLIKRYFLFISSGYTSTIIRQSPQLSFIISITRSHRLFFSSTFINRQRRWLYGTISFFECRFMKTTSPCPTNSMSKPIFFFRSNIFCRRSNISTCLSFRQDSSCFVGKLWSLRILFRMNSYFLTFVTTPMTSDDFAWLVQAPNCIVTKHRR